MSDKAEIGKRVCVFAYWLICASLIASKACGLVSWSWWWVTAPLWIPCGLILLVILACVIAFLLERDFLESDAYDEF